MLSILTTHAYKIKPNIHNKTFGGNRYFYHFDHSDDIKLYILNVFSFLAYNLKHHNVIKIEERKKI